MGGMGDAELIVAVDVGSARVACAVAEIGDGPPRVLAAELADSYGIRGGEIVDIARAGEAIAIAIQAAAGRAEAEVRSVVVGLSGDVKLSPARAAVELDAEARAAGPADVARARAGLSPEIGPGRKIVHCFEGPYSVGDMQGVERPEGLRGDRLEMQAVFLSASSDRMENVLNAVRAAGVEIETVSLEPVSSSIGALSPDERLLGAALLDLGAGAFRGALWEGGRLRQLHTVGRENLGLATVSGMEGVVMAVARRFRIAPATAERLLRSHAALDDDALAGLPPEAEVAAVDGLGSVRISTRELASTIDELLVPVARSLREGLSGFSAGHAVGVVLSGGGARIKGMPAWFSRRFGGAPVRVATPRWKIEEGTQIAAELSHCAACALAGLLILGQEERARLRARRGGSFLKRLAESLRRLAASY